MNQRIKRMIERQLIYREKALIRSHQTANKRQAELAAVGMTGEYQIYFGFYIKVKQLRPVG